MHTRKDNVTDDFFGTSVVDPYRWLEDSDSPEVAAWTREQNELTRKTLDAFGGVEQLRARVKELFLGGYAMGPAIRTRANGTRRYFHQRREGEQNQPILYVRDGVRGADRVLIDPAKLSDDVTTALDWWHASNEGSRIAYGRSESGSEESTLYVRDVDAGRDLATRIPNTRHASIAWLPGGESFFYSRHPAKGAVPAGEEQYHSKIYRHVIGRDPDKDELVFAPKEKTDIPSVDISPNGRWLIVRVHMGWARSDLWLRDLAAGEGAPFVPIAQGIDALFEPIALDDRLYVLTNHGAPRYRLYEVDYARVERDAWRPILDEGEDVLATVTVIGDTLVADFMHDAASRIERFSRDGRSLGAIDLPTIGSASVQGAWNGGDEAFITFASFTIASEVHRFDLASGAMELWDRVPPPPGIPKIRVRRVNATSKDGTRVPMFVVEPDGAAKRPRPTVLYGYGGFNINQTPMFSVRALTIVEAGATWVTAVLRGGGEFGEAWHRGGMREKKQNVFDDLYACAETLAREKVADPARLAVMGGSNGGLLVAAAVTQRPELWRAGLSLVPLCDMLRYHHFRIAKLWIPEYGCAEDKDDFPFLYAYSPYHHVEPGRDYPAMFFATAESDSRVDPMHARKMAARMQDAQDASAARPVLLRVESKAGHGAGKPITKVVDEMADELAFVFHELDV